MAFRWLKAAIAVVTIAVLSSCSFTGRQPIERPLYYDVRDVAVIAGARVSQVLIAGTDRRIAEAIAVTRRPVALPRVVLTVSIRDYAPGGVFADRRPRATFKVVATSVDNGMDVAAGTFTVFSETDNPYFLDESLAEQVAARVRFAFSLATPPAVRRERPRQPQNRPATQSAARPAASEPAMSPAAAVPPPPVSPAAPAAAPVTQPVTAAPSSRPIPPVIPPVVPTAPVSPPAAKRVPEPEPAAGTNVEDGAKGSISLDKPACDPKEDPECQQPQQ